MTCYLCISVTFVDPLFHGKRDHDEPEWPPSSMRLFQALIAGARAGCRNREWSETDAEAFRWLTSRQPPLIIAPESRPGCPYSLYVPNNDSDKEPERSERLTTKTVRPQHLLCGDTVHYLWSIDKPTWPAAQHNADVICSAARHLLALGWGIDQVVGNGRLVTCAEASALPGQRWRA